MSSRTHVFAVGVENCQQGQIESVAYAENDARGFVDAWKALGADSRDCVLFLRADVAKAPVESALKKFLKSVTADDTVVFFFSGHCDAGFSLVAALDELQTCEASKTLLFLDNASGNFATDALRDFCENGSNRIVYLACGTEEVSLKSTKLKHSIWTHALIKALSGNAKEVLADGNSITGESLRDQLAARVPQLIRSIRSGSEIQTPTCIGDASKELVIADLAILKESQGGDPLALGNALKDTFLRGVKLGLVRNLSGFQKGHRVPDRHFGATENFVRKIGHEKVQQQADTIFKDLRTAFAYRRKETVYDCVDGAATIKTPDFDVDLSIAQDPTDPGGYTTTVEIGNIRTPEVVLSQEFSDVFSDHCDTVVISLSRPIDVEEKIDDIEANPNLRGYLDYDAECTSFTLKLQSPNITIHVTENEVTLRLRDAQELTTLLRGLQSALATLNDSGVLELAATGE